MQFQKNLAPIGGGITGVFAPDTQGIAGGGSSSQQVYPPVGPPRFNIKF